jgi:hypothetical protein
MAYASNSKPLELTAVTALAADDTIIVGVTSDLNEVVQTITKANFDADIAITASQVTDFQTAVAANSAVAANTAKVSYTDAAKVAGIEAGADVTDAINVTAAGALMDSEVTNLAQVKAFDTTDYATAAQGATADSALQDITTENLDDLANVVVPTPVSGQLLGFNGANWVNVSNLVAGISPGAIFYNSTPTVTATGTSNALAIKTLSKTPIVTAEQTDTVELATNTVAISAWLNDALNITSIPAGIWQFDTYAGVSAINGGRVSTITQNVYAAVTFITGTVTTTGTGTSRTATASAGTPFATSAIDASATNTTASYLQTPQGLYQITARTSDTVVTITTPTGYVNESAVTGGTWKRLFGATSKEVTDISPSYGLYAVNSTQAAFTVTAATKLASIHFGTCNNTVTMTVPYNGTDHNTAITTTLATIHNDLVGLDGGTAGQYYHATAVEYAVLQNTSGTNTGDEAAASTTVAGVVELDTDAEFTTGTDETRYVNAKQVASVAQTVSNKDLSSATNKQPIRYVAVSLNATTALTTAEKAYFRIPTALTGMNLVSVTGTVGTGAAGSSSSGLPTFTVNNKTDTTVMLSTSLTIDASEYTSATAATAVVIDTTKDDVVTDDLIEVAVTTAGTGTQYTVITLGFQLP